MRGSICPRCHASFPPNTTPEPVAPRCARDGWQLIEDRRGQVIAGCFVLEGLLGVGGGGSAVWRATELGTSLTFAVKLIPARPGTETQRFERGVRLAAELEHPNLVRYLEHGRHDELRFVVMELLEGETVQALLARCKILSPHDAVALAGPILEALAVAHARGIVHRDLKPSNLFVLKASPDAPAGPPHVKILDFGIAKMAPVTAAQRFGPFFPDDDDETRGDLGEAEVTGKHRICGTPEYMAPEQILAGPPDPRSDLYAVGLLLYRLLSGAPPFRAKTRFEMYHRHLHDIPAAMPASLGVPPALEAVIARALAKRPEERHADALLMRQALLAAIDAPVAQSPSIFPRIPTREYARVDAVDGSAHLHLIPPAPQTPEPDTCTAMQAPTVVASLPMRARSSKETRQVDGQPLRGLREQVPGQPLRGLREQVPGQPLRGLREQVATGPVLPKRQRARAPTSPRRAWKVAALGLVAAGIALAIGLGTGTPDVHSASPTADGSAPAPSSTAAASPAPAHPNAVVSAPLRSAPGADPAAVPCP